MKGFNVQMAAQKQRAKAATSVETGDWISVHKHDAMPLFLGYDQLTADAVLLQYRKVESKKEGIRYQLVFDKTPFYPEGGGQVGDTGMIRSGEEVIEVLDTRRENELLVHFTKKLPSVLTESFELIVDSNRRRLVLANHSATHLLHAALRKVLGDHVEQRGSLVSDQGLRFDFSHFARMTGEEIHEVEALVNEQIRNGVEMEEHRGVSMEAAREMGAMALFGEKYGETVRVVVFDKDYSVELCGGTHVKNTSEIRYFKITSEASSAAGIRRVEALTSDKAIEYLEQQESQLTEVSTILKNPKDLKKALLDLVEKHQKLEKQLDELNKEQVKGLRSELKNSFEEVGEVKLLAKKVEVPTADELKNLAFDLGRDSASSVILLGSVINGKPMLNLYISKDIAGEKYNAGQMIREIAKHIQGGGGGQPFFANAGGKNPDGVEAAVAAVRELL